MTRRGWVKPPARVIDREILADFGATEAGPSYNFQLLCEVEYRGERYHVTPLPNWMSLPRPQLEALWREPYR